MCSTFLCASHSCYAPHNLVMWKQERDATPHYSTMNVAQPTPFFVRSDSGYFAPAQKQRIERAIA